LSKSHFLDSWFSNVCYYSRSFVREMQWGSPSGISTLPSLADALRVTMALKAWLFELKKKVSTATRNDKLSYDSRNWRNSIPASLNYIHASNSCKKQDYSS
jgi:hypothetical protein